MGMRDILWVNCPNCEELIEEQFRWEGECCNEFELCNLPEAVHNDFTEDIEVCEKCGETYTYIVKEGFIYITGVSD